MNSPRKQAFTLVELIVVIVVLGVLVSFLLPSANKTRCYTQVNVCRSNLKQLHTALMTRETSQKNFPGYINTLGQSSDTQARASWVVSILPYMEQDSLAQQWENGNYAYSNIDIFICPQSSPGPKDKPTLSYVANAGYIANANSVENKANGVFLDYTRMADGAPGPMDERDRSESPKLIMTLANIKDGTARTLLLSENLQAIHWGYTTQQEQQSVPDQKYHFGFCWEQPGIVSKAATRKLLKRVRRINGKATYKNHKDFSDMPPNDGFPSSNHPGGVHVAFVAGNVQVIAETIDPLVYAQLMTSNSKKSDLRDTQGKPETELTLHEDQY